MKTRFIDVPQTAFRLRKMREQHGYTKGALAEALQQHGIKISSQGIGKWELGQSLPKLKCLCILSDLYTCPLDDLLVPASDPPAVSGPSSM